MAGASWGVQWCDVALCEREEHLYENVVGLGMSKGGSTSPLNIHVDSRIIGDQMGELEAASASGLLRVTQIKFKSVPFIFMQISKY